LCACQLAELLKQEREKYKERELYIYIYLYIYFICVIIKDISLLKDRKHPEVDRIAFIDVILTLA
jgi:hypothetical protein